MSCNDCKKDETDMTDYQTKILLAAIADMLNSSADINEARARFASITSGEFASVMRTDNSNNKPKDEKYSCRT